MACILVTSLLVDQIGLLVTWDDEQPVQEHAAIVVEDGRVVWTGPGARAPEADDRLLVAGGILGLQLGRIDDGNKIPGLHRGAFVDQQLLQTTWSLRAHNDLVGINGADQHQVAVARGGKKVISQSNQENDSEKNEKAVTRIHLDSPSTGRAVGWKRAAEMKSSTAARRAAMRSGLSGSCCVMSLMKGAIPK